MRKLYAVLIAAVGVLAGFSSFAASASAQVTLGQMAPATTSTPFCINSPYDLIPGVVVAGNSYAAPSAGAILSWSTFAATGNGQQLNFKVFRPTATKGQYLVVARDARNLTAGVINTFKVAIPVQAGDLIGDQDANASAVPNACLFNTGNPGNITFEEEGDVLPGHLVQGSLENEEYLPNVTATFLPAPAISALTTASGSIAGGERVDIVGANFAEVKSVSFGSIPAASFTVDAESQITAIAPASATVGAVPISVTTVAGSATSPQSFSYQGCTVPKLKGKKLKGAKKKLRKADCKVGKLKKKQGATAKTGKVTKQSVKPGTVLPPGAKIVVTLKP